MSRGSPVLHAPQAAPLVCQADRVVGVGSSGRDGIDGTADDLWVRSR